MKIEYVYNNIIAFSIDSVIWFLDTNNYIIYDHKLNKQHIINIDNWIQVQTKQQYSLRSVADMASAFLDGLNSGYCGDDVLRMNDYVTQYLLDLLFKYGYIRYYLKIYWIELLSDDKILKYSATIRENFDKLSQFGDDFYNKLYRFWKIASNLNSNESDVFEKMLIKIGKDIHDPVYPDSSEADNIVKSVITHNMTKINRFKNIDNNIIKSVLKLENDSD